MIAQIITYQAQQIALLCAQPNWASELKISLELPTDISKEAITFTESRRAFAQTARYTMQWRAYLSSADDATELRIFLTRVRGEPVWAPLWPDACEMSAAISQGGTVISFVDAPVRFGNKWIIANDDFSLWEIVSGILVAGPATSLLNMAPGTQLAWPAGTRAYPILVGRLTDRPKPESISDETFEVDLSIKENSQFAYRLSPRSAALPLVGTNISAFATTPLFDVAPNWVQPVDWTEQPDIIYQEIGFLRTEQQREYDHRNARGMEMEFYQNAREDISRIERFWRTQRGPVLRFMAPSWHGDMRMTENTPIGGNLTWIRVEPTEFTNPGRQAQPGDPFIALIDQNNSIDPRQLSGTQQLLNETRLISSTNLSAHLATTTIVSHLLLARFQESMLTWTYITPYLATTRVKFQELPHEYTNPPAPLPEPAYLFIFTEVGVRTDRFTSYENTIQIPTGTWAGTYVPAPFSFETLKTGLKLDQEKLDFQSFKFAGNPLNKMWPFALDGLLTLDVIEIDARNPQSTSATHRFSGDVWSVDADYKATALAFGNFFERKFPRFLLSVSDNYTQFSAPTNLAASAFKITGAIFSRSSQTVVITSVTGHAKAADYFSGGWLETGTGANVEKRGILHSEPSSTDRVTLHLDRPLIKAMNGQALDLYPGYDGSIDQCDTKFNNRINFGGHPYIPNVNPTVKAMKAKTVQGGKK